MNSIQETTFKKEDIIKNGTKFIIGNIYLGYRGTLEEYTKNEMVSLNLPLVYDGLKGLWRESVNIPNPFYVVLYANGIKLSPLEIAPLAHLQELNLKDGVHFRKTEFKIESAIVKIASLRFISKVIPKLMVMKYSFSVSSDTDILIETGIDLDIYEINGPHLTNYRFQEDSNNFNLLVTTSEKKEITISETIDTNFLYDFAVSKDDQKYLRKITLKAQKNQEYIIYKYARIFYQEVLSLGYLDSIKATGYDLLLRNHQEAFNKEFELADIKITGDQEADIALRYSIYQLLILAPGIRKDSSIPARGISGQTYKGAVFWDTEMFMLPFYLNFDLASAKSIIYYRINSLNGATKKAQSYGYMGAFYPWESQEDGFDACSDYNVTDVFTKRAIRTYFKDKQIHINADIVYGFWEYYQRTNDLDTLAAGFDMVYQIALFYYSYSYLNVAKKRIEFLDVLGPDEYHERVNNNAFTNQMILYSYQVLKEASKILKEYKKSDLSKYQKLEELINFSKKIYIKKPLENGIIEQFDGYFKLEDIGVSELLNKRINPHEYLGGYGLAGTTKVIKQADVITMLYLFAPLYKKEVLEANFNYYEKFTEHGSSLSASMYALVACLIGKPDYAYPHFMKSATVDLSGKSKEFAGGVYIGGTHPAAAGGAYMTLVYGFVGLKIKGDQITVNPRLPKSIKAITFNIMHKGKIYNIDVSEKENKIKEVTYD